MYDSYWSHTLLVQLPYRVLTHLIAIKCMGLSYRSHVHLMPIPCYISWMWALNTNHCDEGLNNENLAKNIQCVRQEGIQVGAQLSEGKVVIVTTWFSYWIETTRLSQVEAFQCGTFISKSGLFYKTTDNEWSCMLVLSIELQVLNMQSTAKSSKSFLTDVSDGCSWILCRTFFHQPIPMFVIMVSYEMMMSLPSPTNGANDLHSYYIIL